MRRALLTAEGESKSNRGGERGGDDLATTFQEDPTAFQKWDATFGDRRSELVCIGRELDKEAASALLAECLLTAEEMDANADQLTMAARFEQHERQHEHEHATTSPRTVLSGADEDDALPFAS